MLFIKIAAAWDSLCLWQLWITCIILFWISMSTHLSQRRRVACYSYATVLISTPAVLLIKVWATTKGWGCCASLQPQLLLRTAWCFWCHWHKPHIGSSTGESTDALYASRTSIATVVKSRPTVWRKNPVLRNQVFFCYCNVKGWRSSRYIGSKVPEKLL